MRIEIKQRKTMLTLLRHQIEARVTNEVVPSEEESRIVAVIMETYRRSDALLELENIARLFDIAMVTHLP
jgi:hypothetical protein